MRTPLLIATLVVASLVPRTRLAAQEGAEKTPVDIGGPRVGLTVLGGGLAEDLRDDFDAFPVVTQFGWQYEARFLPFADNGTTGVTELVLLIGGAEQGLFLPSITWLVGVRSARGAEFGLGPNVSLAGAAMAMGGGVTLRAGNVNVPMNLAVVPSGRGVRISLLTGFNMRRE
ncbi:MAG: hypothetical protein HY701_02335 [Gemmatimonadetes bacterium]|nr:hypothetical protein [Gemmatimonadota bacterium]